VKTRIDLDSRIQLIVQPLVQEEQCCFHQCTRSLPLWSCLDIMAVQPQDSSGLDTEKAEVTLSEDLCKLHNPTDHLTQDQRYHRG